MLRLIFTSRVLVWLEFFASVILLLSDLCLDSNNYAIEILEKQYQFDWIHQIISCRVDGSSDKGDQMDYGLIMKNAFTRLMITLWIDRQENTRILLPNKIRIWGQLNQKQMKDNLILNKKKSQQLKSFVKKYIQEVTTKKENKFSFSTNQFINQKAYEEE